MAKKKHAELTATADVAGNITIVLPAALLKHYVSEADGFVDAKIVDLPLFAKDVAKTLVDDQEEDGIAHLHRAFDSAFERYSEGHLFSDGLKFED